MNVQIQTLINQKNELLNKTKQQEESLHQRSEELEFLKTEKETFKANQTIL